MPRKFNRRQALENQAFLRALARTGNVRLAARELGVHRSTFTKRRARHPAFAAEWDAALALAHATLNAQTPSSEREHAQETPSRSREGAGGGPPLSTSNPGGGRPNATTPSPEPQITRLANGRLQLRAPAKRRLTREHQQAFLAALSATANVRLSARAAGFSHSAFYQLRDHNPAFAREMRLALQLGYERIEMALLASFEPESCRDDAWRTNDVPPIPSMTTDQALQLLMLHQKEARLWDTRPDRKAKRGEAPHHWALRVAAKWRAEKAWDREGYAVDRAVREQGVAPPRLEHPAPILPALDQVTGWSAAGREKPVDPMEVVLFGGWRLKDWEG